MRFIRIQDHDKYPEDGGSVWYWDTGRPTPHLEGDGLDDYVAVQVRKGKDPNRKVVYHNNLRLLFEDGTKYFAVCMPCYYGFAFGQWKGTGIDSEWRDKSGRYLKYHQDVNGWCEFCDPVFGTGGWK